MYFVNLLGNPMRPRHCLAVVAVPAALFLACPDGAEAQEPAGELPAAQEEPGPVSAPVIRDWPMEVFTGGELERYLRTLQNVGLVAPHPWGLRGFSAGDVRRMGPAPAGHPWAERLEAPQEAAEDAGGIRYGLLPLRAVAQYNSHLPWGSSEDARWAGRGLTSGVEAGGWFRWGPLSAVVAPMAFRSQNRSFPLIPNGQEGPNRFRSPLSPNNVDLPQRFGDEAYQRVGWGHSELRVEGRGVSLGLSGAPQQWGGAERHPLVLGPNAGGFAHGFLGTERPVSVGVGRLHARYVWGRLEQSDWAPTREVGPRRLASGFVASFTPRGLPGIEVGVTRFLHRDWPGRDLRWDHFTLPLEFRFKSSIPDYDQRMLNQLASAFFRVNVPGAGFEFFGELVRVDHATTSRLLLLEPDDLAGGMVGFRRVLGDPDRGLTVIRGEALATVSSHRERTGNRPGLAFRGRPMYQHSQVVQGHTHRGQLLASPAGHGGHAHLVAVDHYTAGGRWTVELERRQERDRTTGIRSGESGADADVTWAAGVGGVRHAGPLELEGALTAARTLNQGLADDRWNLHLALGARARLP